jgi:hypothetical protein
LKEFFHSHSERTILYRYFTPLHDLPPELVQQFVNLDYHNNMPPTRFWREPMREATALL